MLQEAIETVQNSNYTLPNLTLHPPNCKLAGVAGGMFAWSQYKLSLQVLQYDDCVPNGTTTC